MDLGVDHSKRVLWTEKIVVLITLKELCGFYTENGTLNIYFTLYANAILHQYWTVYFIHAYVMWIVILKVCWF